MELIEHYKVDLEKAEEAEERIKEIEEAYEILGNEISRCGYDFERGLEKDLRRSYVKRAQSRKERKINIRKIMLSAGFLFFSLIVGLIIFRWSHVAVNPKSETHHVANKILEKKTASQIPPAKIESKVIEEKEVPKEIKKEVMPQEINEIVSVSPQRSLSGVESASKEKQESAKKILPKSEVPVKAKEEVLAKEEPKPVKELAPQVTTKSETPAAEQVSKEAPEEIPKETQKKIAGATLHPGEKLAIVAKEEEKVPKETGKVAPQESPRIDKPNPAVIEPQPVQKPETPVKPGKVVFLSPSPLAKQEEVKQFFSSYIDRYNQKDIDGFLSSSLRRRSKTRRMDSRG